MHDACRHACHFQAYNMIHCYNTSDTGVCVKGTNWISSRPWNCQSCTMTARPCSSHWNRILMPSIVGPFVRSWGMIGEIMCPTNVHREIGLRPVSCSIHPRRIPPTWFVSIRDNPGWRRSLGRPRKSRLGQIDQACWSEVRMGRPPALRVAKRDPRGWKRGGSAAKRPSRH